MFINILADGTTQSIEPERIYQGSNKANTIYVLAPFSANIQATISFEIEATGEITTPYLMERPIEVSNEMNVWTLDVEKILTQYYGNVKYQIKFTSNSQIVATARGRFKVIEGVDTILPDTPTQEVYELILQRLSDIEALFTNGWIEAQGVKQYNSEFSYSLGAIAFGELNGRIEIFKSLVEANTGNALGNREAWQPISNFAQVDTNTQDIADTKKNVSEIDTRVTQNKTTLDEHSTTIESNTTRIETLEQQSLTGLTFIGVYPANETLPNSNELTQFVFDNTSPNRSPKSGDFVKFTQIIQGDTDKNLTIYFGNKKWGEWVEELPVEKAKNSDYGVVTGSKGKDKNVEVNLVDGNFEDITTKNIEGNQVSISKRLNDIDNIQSKFIDGTQPVGVAKQSIADKNGNEINTTYAMQSSVYTKAQSDERYLSSAYANEYYFSKDGLVDDLPTEPVDQKQFEVLAPQGIRTTVFDVSRIADEVYNFTKNTTEASEIWVKADKDAVGQFFLISEAYQDETLQLLANDLTGQIALKGGELTKLAFNTSYTALGSQEYKLRKGGQISKRLEFISPNEAVTISVYCGAQNVSSTHLSTQSISFNVNTINGKKKIVILASEWADNGDGTFTVTIPQTRHEQAPSTEYGLDLQFNDTANSVQRIEFTPKIKDNGDIEIKSYDAIDCELLIWNSIGVSEKALFTLKNPTQLADIDYTQFGAVTITQTNEPSELTLPLPANVSQYYSFFVSNDKASTKEIKVNGLTVEVDNGVKFKWNGRNWQLDDMPDKTSEITDDLNGQPLNDTLATISTKANKDGSNIQVEVWQNILGVNLKANNKSVELKEGLAVDNLIDFFRYFYDLRKGLNDTWEFEVGEGKNENIMNIFGFPYGESPTNSAELIVKRIATSGIGYTLELTFASKKSNTTHTAFVRGWIISGTSYDKYIHFTGWRNARGGQWVDEVNGEVTLTDTTELVLNIGEFKNPYNNFLIAEVTKDNHSYNAFLMLSITAPNVGETTIKLDNEDVYVKVDYNAKTFAISKTSSGTETLKVHLYEKLI